MRRKSLVTGALSALVGLFAMFAAEAPAAAAPGDGVVSGTVAVPGGHAVTGVNLYLASASGDAVVAGPVNPDGAGAYQFTGVPDGSYTVFAETPADSLAWQWSGAGRDASEADPVTIADGSTAAGVDFSLVAGASISGTITVPSGSAPEDSGAFADRPAGAAAVAPPGTVTAGGQYADAASDGTYTIGNLPDLTFLVRFPTAGAALVTQYYNGVYTAAAATPVSPSVGQAVTGINANLVRSVLLVINGTFKDVTSSMCYTVRNGDSSITRSACTDPGVAHASEVLPNGLYTLSAWESNATHGNTSPMTWSNGPGSYYPELHAAFDFTLKRFPDELGVPGSLAITVTEWTTGTPVTNGCVEAYNAAGTVARTSCSPVAGVFTLAGLPAGQYKVRATNQTGMVPMWFGPAASRTAATALTVADDTTTSAAIRVVPPYSLVGKVIDGDGNPVVGGVVELWKPIAPNLVTSTTTGPDGTYLLTSSQCYSSWCNVRFGPVAGHPESWYPNRSAYSAVDQLTVSPSAPTVLANQTISATPARVTGTIAVPAYFTSSVVCVVLESKYNSQVQGPRTYGVACGERGRAFEFADLPARTQGFTICAVDAPAAPAGCATAAPVNYLGSASAPTLFTTTAGGTTAVTLNYGTTWSRTVRVGTSSGPLMTQGCVELWTDTGVLVSTVCDPSDGVVTFAFPNDMQTYRIKYVGVRGGDDVWMSGAPGDSPNGFSVVDGTPTTGSLVVPRGATITGTITLPGGTTATAGCVMAWDITRAYNTSGHAAEACANPATGVYTLQVPSGSYRLEYYTHTTDVASLWNGGAPDEESAPIITFRGIAYDVPTVINIALPAAGGIIVGADDSQRGPVVNGCFHAVNAIGAVVMTRCLSSATDVLLDSLLPGSYTVYFDGNDETGPAWFGGETPQVLTVAAGAPQSVRIAADPLGAISATITGPSGAVPTGGCLTAYSEATGDVVVFECTATGGVVTLKVPAGSYFLMANSWSSAGALADEWWSSDDSGVAEAVAVAIGSTTPVTVALGERSGIVRIAPTFKRATYSSTVAATGGCAYAYRLDGELAAAACADDGESSVDLHVPGGSYAIYIAFWVADVDGVQTFLAPTWYGGGTSFTTATPVASDGAQLVALAQSLVRDGRIGGQITLSEGTPATGGTVEAYDRATGVLLADAQIGSTGNYLVSGLADGSSVVLRVRDVPGAPDQWLAQSGVRNLRSNSSGVVASSTYTSLSTSWVLAPAGSLDVTLQGVPGAETPEVCATLWGIPSWTWYPSSDISAAEFVAEKCGSVGETVNFDNVVASANYAYANYGIYAVSFTDGNGDHQMWPIESGVWGHPVVVTNIRDSGSTTYEAAPLQLIAPADAVWPWEPVTLYLVSNEVVNGTRQIMLSRLRDGYPTEFTRSVTFVNGVAEIPLDTATEYGGYTTYWVAMGDERTGQEQVTWAALGVYLQPLGYGIVGSNWTGLVTLSEPWDAIGTVWYAQPGTEWKRSTTQVIIRDGEGSFTMPQASGTYWYAVTVGRWESMEWEVYPIGQVTGTLTGPSSVIRGTDATLDLLIAQYNTYTSGTGILQQRAPGGTWTNAGITVPFVHGAGAVTVTPTAPTTEYRVILGPSSNPTFIGGPLTITTTPPALTLAAPATVNRGSNVTLAVDVPSGVSGVGQLQTKAPGGTWVSSALTVPILDGVGSVSVPQTANEVAYRVTLLGGTSNEVTVLASDPVVGFTGSTEVIKGDGATLAVTVSGSYNGQAALQYLLPGGSWQPLPIPVPVTAGVGSVVVHPSAASVQYRVAGGASVSPAVTVTTRGPSVTLTGASSITRGTSTTFTVGVEGGRSGTAVLQSLVPGGMWTNAPAEVTVTAGAATVTVAPTAASTSYRVLFGGGTSNVLALATVAPSPTLSGPSAAVRSASVNLAVDAGADVDGPVTLQSQLPGAAWVTSTATITMVDGLASFTVVPTAASVSYRVIVQGGTSNVLVISTTAPVVTLAGATSVVRGATATYTVNVDGGASGVAALQYARPGGAWTTSTKTVTVTAGEGTFTLTPVDPLVTYRVVLLGTTSNLVPVATTVPVVTLAGATSVPRGTTSTYTVTVDGGATGVAALQYARPGGAWTTSTMTVSVVSGVGTFNLTPVDPLVTYRVVLFGSTSNLVPVATTVPVVTLAGATSVPRGTTSTYTVTVDGGATGVAALQYARPGGAWTTSTKTVPVTAGTGTFTLTPVDPLVTYRVVLFGSTSNSVPVATTVPVVTLAGATSVPRGSTSTYMVNVDGGASGVAALQYARPGGAWTTSSLTVSVVSGVGTFNLTPVDPLVTYRVVLFGSTSNSVPVATTVPVVTLAGATSVPRGTTSTYTVTVDGGATGVAALQYARPGGAWTTSSLTVSIISGVGTFNLTPVDPLVTYRVVLFGSTSNSVPVATTVPAVTLAGATSVTRGTTATYTVNVDGGASGTAALQYMRPGGAWTTSTKTVPVTAGVGTFTLTPVDPLVTYRVVLFGSTSNSIPVATTVASLSLAGGTTLIRGETSVLTVTLAGGGSGTASLQTQVPGGSWATSSATIAIVDGVGTLTVRPLDATMSYRVLFGGGTSNTATITTTAPTVELYGPDMVVRGELVWLELFMPGAIDGTGAVQTLAPGGSWTTTSYRMTIEDSYGYIEVPQTAAELDYRVSINGLLSNVGTVYTVAPQIELTGPTSITRGGSVTHTVTLDAPITGKATLQIAAPGADWATSSLVVNIVDGVGTFTTSPTAAFSLYRVGINGGYSDPVTIATVTPTINLTGDSTITRGTSTTLSMSVSGSPSGIGAVEYQLPGGAWTATSLRVPVTAGVGTLAVAPTDAKISYRVVFGSAASNPVTVTTVPALMTLDGSATAGRGTVVTVRVDVDPHLDINAVLQYQRPGGTWTNSTMPVTITAGTGTFTAVQTTAGTLIYRIVIGGVASPTVTLVWI